MFRPMTSLTWNPSRSLSMHLLTYLTNESIDPKYSMKMQNTLCFASGSSENGVDLLPSSSSSLPCQFNSAQNAHVELEAGTSLQTVFISARAAAWAAASRHVVQRSWASLAPCRTRKRRRAWRGVCWQSAHGFNGTGPRATGCITGTQGGRLHGETRTANGRPRGAASARCRATRWHG